jgi:Major Facilitator Superfamily.
VTASGAYREILAIRDARRLISASAVSQLGDWLFNAALLGTVYAATGSPRWVGAATICRLLPYVVLGPIGGVVADRYDRRTVLLAGDVSRVLLMVALAGVVQADAPMGLILALTALASAAGTVERPAAMALLPRLVGEARLGPANALLHTVQDLGVVVGPAIGALLLAAAPNAVAFLATGSPSPSRPRSSRRCTTVLSPRADGKPKARAFTSSRAFARRAARRSSSPC